LSIAPGTAFSTGTNLEMPTAFIDAQKKERDAG
jgi:hypothetical protein